jgi:hypothetical protein
MGMASPSAPPLRGDRPAGGTGVPPVVGPDRRPAGPTNPNHPDPGAPPLAAWLWVALLLVVCLRAALAPHTHTLFPTYADAGRNWLAGRPLYDVPKTGLDTFRYTPAVAALLAPWGMLPDDVGGVLFRLANAAVLLAALRVWCRGGGLSFAAAALVVLPLAVHSLNNAQVNPLVTGLLLATLAFFTAGRWTGAAAALTFAFLLKGYPLALGMLLCLVEPRRFGIRFGAGVCLGLLAPFALQAPGYVAAQYDAWLERLVVDDRSGWPLYAGYQDLAMLLKAAGASVGGDDYTLVQLSMAAACAAVVLAGRLAGWERGRLAWACGGLGVGWMVLLGPATETCTFLLLAPFAARVVLAATGWTRAAVAAGLVLLVGALVALWFPASVSRPVLSTGVQPLGALLIVAGVAGDVVTKKERGEKSGVRSEGRQTR